jgi:type VI secretion system protein VasD
LSALRCLRDAILILAALSLTACGAAQAVHDGSVSAATWAFVAQIPTMNLDVINRTADKTSPTIVRVYQLKSPQNFKALTDEQWLTNDVSMLKADLLATNNLVLAAGANGSVRTPMHDDAQYVGMVALQGSGDGRPTRLLIPRKQWAGVNSVDVDLDRGVLRLHQQS